MIDYFEEDIISKREQLFNQVLNRKVVKMIRFSVDPKEEFGHYYGIKDTSKAFSLSEGILTIEFDNGTIIAFYSYEKICSVVSWAERLDGKCSKNVFMNDNELYPISADDPVYSNEYFSKILNKELIKYEIIKEEPFSVKYYDLPREVGLVLYFSSNTDIVIAHQLTKEVSEAFTVINLEMIDKTIYPTLYKMSEFW